MDINYSIHKIDEIIIHRISRRKYDNPLEELKSIFALFQELLKTNYVKNINDDKVFLWEHDVVENIKKSCKDLEKVLYSYMYGDLMGCYKILGRLFKSTVNKFTKQVQFPTVSIARDSIWFRARNNEAMKSMECRDLFHVPFNKRAYVTTKRYSIPGYPCLYMANSVMCCYKEIGMRNNISVSSFRLKEDIEVYDFTFFPEENKDPKRFWSLLELYPFKIACAILVNEHTENSVFIPEYIIPQFVLHCTIKQKGNKIDGIIYTSTKGYSIDVTESINAMYTNLVIPVKEIKEEGFCCKLQDKFSMTKPRNINVAALMNDDMFDEFEKQEEHNEYLNIKLDQ